MGLARGTPFIYNSYEFQQAMNQKEKKAPIVAMAPLAPSGVRAARHPRGVHWSQMSCKLQQLPLTPRLPCLPEAPRLPAATRSFEVPKDVCLAPQVRTKQTDVHGPWPGPLQTSCGAL